MFNIGLCNRILVDFYVKPRAICVFFIGVVVGFFPFPLAVYDVSFIHGQKLRSVSLGLGLFVFLLFFFLLGKAIWVRCGAREFPTNICVYIDFCF